MSQAEVPIAVVSALTEELAPLLGRLTGLRRERIGDLDVARGELAGRSVCLCTTGEGLLRASSGARGLFERLPVEAMIGIGVAGGLSEELSPGAVVWSRSVRDPKGEQSAAEASGMRSRAEASVNLRGGTVVTVMSVLQTPVAKRELASRLGIEGVVVADLESSAWVAAAKERKIPWLVLRAVSDGLDESLPMDFEEFRGADGSISRARVVAHAATRPRLLLKLNRLRRRVAKCADALADSTEELLS